MFAVHAASALDSAREQQAPTKTPVYVVLRMDDTQHSWMAEEQKAVLEWAIENKVKYNVGVIAGPLKGEGKPWPTTCAADSQIHRLAYAPILLCRH